MLAARASAPSTRAGGAPAARICPFPRTSTAPRASTWPTPIAAASSPTTAPASSSAIRSWRSTMSVRYLRTMETAIVDALCRRGHRRTLACERGRRLHRRLGAGSQDRLDRRARLARVSPRTASRSRPQRSAALLLGTRVMVPAFGRLTQSTLGPEPGVFVVGAKGRRPTWIEPCRMPQPSPSVVTTESGVCNSAPPRRPLSTSPPSRPTTMATITATLTN